MRAYYLVFQLNLYPSSVTSSPTVHRLLIFHVLYLHSITLSIIFLPSLLTPITKALKLLHRFNLSRIFSIFISFRGMQLYLRTWVLVLIPELCQTLRMAYNFSAVVIHGVQLKTMCHLKQENYRINNFASKRENMVNGRPIVRQLFYSSTGEIYYCSVTDKSTEYSDVQQQKNNVSLIVRS